jgi:hypothetical protein
MSKGKPRLAHLGADESDWPDNLHLVTEAPKLDTGLVPTIETFLDEHPETRVVAIDTVARVRGKHNRDEDLDSGASRVMEQLQAVCIRMRDAAELE